MDLYLKIYNQTNVEQLNLTNTEKTIMKYIYLNRDNFEHVTISEISKNCHCSRAAIHRFVNKYDCSGFKQFKTELVSSRRFTKFSTSQFQINMNDLISYIQSIDTSSFRDKLLTLKNKRIYVYGVGASYISAQYLSRQLNRYDIDAIAYQLTDRDGLTDLADAIFFISHSGETSNIVEKAHQVQLSSIETFAITRSDSSLAKLCDISLVHNEKFTINDFTQKESQLATILLIENLFYELT